MVQHYKTVHGTKQYITKRYNYKTVHVEKWYIVTKRYVGEQYIIKTGQYHNGIVRH